MTWTLQGTIQLGEGERDEEGHRTYPVRSRLITNDPGNDGPANALRCPGLPEPGDEWNFGKDADIWAWCRWDAKIRRAPEIKVGDKVTQVDVDQTFSTKPLAGNRSRCQDEKVEDPLLEPPKISGSFVNAKEEATFDRFGYGILNSAYEQINGPQNEWDAGTDTIKIEQNLSSPYLAYVLPSQFKNCVNAFPLFGFDRRCVKLKQYSWDRKFYGRCSVYYQRTLEFETNTKSFDRDIRDEGTKVLRGHWNNATGDWVLDPIAGRDPSPFDPRDFIRFQDRNGGNTRVILNGAGQPAGVRVVGSRVVVTRPGNPYRASGAVGTWYTDPGGRISRIGLDSAIGQPVLVDTGNTPHRLTTGTRVTIADLTADNLNYNGSWIITVVSPTTFTLNGTRTSLGFRDAGTYYQSGNVTVTSGGSPISVFTDAPHGLSSGQGVTIEDCWGNDDADGSWVVTVTGASSFTLNGSVSTQDSGDKTGTGTGAISEPRGPGYIHVEKYDGVDFLLLGIPTNF